MWREQEWPSAWRDGTIIPILKSGGDSLKVSDHRPITLSSSLSKLFETLLLNRLSSWAEGNLALVEEQGGFRAKRSTRDQLWTLNEILAIRRQAGVSTFMAFLDVKSAYDRVWRSGLLHRLAEQGIRGRMFAMIQSMLSASTRKVGIHGSFSESFSLAIGVPQGSVLSPLLYALFINGLAVKLNNLGLGVPVFARRVSVLLYADDLLLLAEDESALQTMLDEAALFSQRWRFRFNCRPGKSEVVVCPWPSQQSYSFSIYGVQLRVSRQYRYLGCEMGQGNWSDFLSRTVAKARAKMLQLWIGVRGRAPLQVAAAVSLFNILVRPVLEYGAEVWGPFCADNNSIRMLDAVQLGRLVLRMRKPVANAYLLQELQLSSMKYRVRKAFLSYYGHLSSLGDNRLAGYIFRMQFGEVEAGRGQLSWCSLIKQFLQSDPSLAEWWSDQPVPANWKSRVTTFLQVQREAEELKSRVALTSLHLFSELLPLDSNAFMHCSLKHPGTRIRLRLRAGVMPLMERVAAQYNVDYDFRWCRICGSREVEDAAHFVSSCAFLDPERNECLLRLNALVANANAPQLKEAMHRSDFSLFLGDSKLQELAGDMRLKADRIICNFLKVAWAKRQCEWLQKWCVEGNAWLLR